MTLRRDGLAVERGSDERPHFAERRGIGRMFSRRGLHLETLRDVAGDLRRADDPPGFVANRRHRQRNREPGAVLTLSDRFEVIDLLTGADLREHGVFFALQLVRNEHANRLPDGFRGGVAEHPFGGGIPRGDDALEILADDRVVARVDDGRQMAARARQALAIADVPGDL